MHACVSHHLGLGRLPCYIADLDPNLRRLDVELVVSTWGIWLLSHVDLRATDRVRACKGFVEGMMFEQKGLVEGNASRFL